MPHPLRSVPFLILGMLSAVGPSAGQPTPEADASPTKWTV
jgi:hypothetical protein